MQEAALPGVTVTAKSPKPAGVSRGGDVGARRLHPDRVAVRSLSITFSLSGFQTHTRNVGLAPTQVLPLEATLGPAQVTEEVTVVGTADTPTKTAQIATNFSQDLIAMLPTSRDLNSILLMAPGVHPTGPAGAFSFGGSVTFENLFLPTVSASTKTSAGRHSIRRLKMRSRKQPSPTAVCPPSSGGSAAASSTSSRSREAINSREASASR